MIEAGADIVAVNKNLGNADLKTTMRYAHPDHSLREAVEALPRYIRADFKPTLGYREGG